MNVRDQLRRLPVLAGPLPAFDVSAAPADPVALFTDWLADAIEANVLEPHAMALSTVGADGQPDTRVLILKDLDVSGWHFATASTSAKGQQIAANPRVALSFYWREQGRQVRVRGQARPADPQTSRADFLARPQGSRIASLSGRQSSLLTDRETLTRALEQARTRLAESPDLVAEDHAVYIVQPETVEFWQGDAERQHLRLRYRRDDGGWLRELLWP
ncbi:MAG TPA: pyridoxal 5'-phosphate synthase [Micromonosporaceae bacterium]|nr:pyridoxal 5'-phosphate synthase [Micromonosporaceae bacterium]